MDVSKLVKLNICRNQFKNKLDYLTDYSIVNDRLNDEELPSNMIGKISKHYVLTNPHTIQDSGLLMLENQNYSSLDQPAALKSISEDEDVKNLIDASHVLSIGSTSIYKQFKYYTKLMFVTKNNHTLMLTSMPNKEISPASFMMHLVNKDDVIVATTSDMYDEYKAYYRAAITINNLIDYDKNLNNIIIFKDEKPVNITLSDLILQLDDEKQQSLIYDLSRVVNSPINQAATIINQFISQYKTNKGKQLLSKEEQIETFLSFAKNSNSKVELISDEMLNNIKDSESYQEVLKHLTDNNFKISKTQQFNALQGAAYFGLSNDRRSVLNNANIFYNLSDMGAGKTLMTIESIFILSLAIYQKTLASNLDEDKKKVLNHASSYVLPDINLLAPKLSIKSSWLDTFKIFYNVVKETENKYKLIVNHNGHKLIQHLYIAPFTVKTTGVRVGCKLPYEDSDSFLIIDEIHQLMNKAFTKTKFFEFSPNFNNYYIFALSGTLSNMTTSQWWNLCKLLNLHIKIDGMFIDSLSSNDVSNALEQDDRKLRTAIKNSVENIFQNKRTFDNVQAPNENLNDNSRKSLTRNYYDLAFAPKIITSRLNANTVKDMLTTHSSDYQFYHIDNKLDTPNFELFYQLVAHQAVTAQSDTIARELFGDVKTQHKATVVKTKSNLTKDDLQLLKHIHILAANNSQYKSKTIAENINNVILNLNDGLHNKSIYDVINQAANHNNRFLAYLSKSNLDILQSIKNSNLIEKPRLEDTEKFKALTKLLQQDKGNTFLIIVNDYDAMRKLANALNVSYFTHKELADEINYQDTLNTMFEKQDIVIVPQMMVKSSLDLVQANRLIQYQLNNNISDIIQTQNRINRVGQTRETKAYYLASDELQANIINLFLDTYRNIKVAHKGITELFINPTSQVNVINDYMSEAFSKLNNNKANSKDTSEINKNLEDENNNILLFDPKPFEQKVEPVISEPEKKPNEEYESGQLSLFDPIEESLAIGLVLDD